MFLTKLDLHHHEIFRLHDFHFFTKLGYYTCTIPYNIRMNPLTLWFEITPVGKARQSMVLFVWLLAYICVIVWLREAVGVAVAKKWDMNSYFIFANLSTFMAKVALYDVKVFMGQERIQLIFDKIQSTSLLNSRHEPRSASSIMARIFITGFHFAYFVFGCLESFSYTDWDFCKIYTDEVATGKFAVFIGNSSELGFVSPVLAAFSIMFKVCFMLQKTFLMALLCIAPLTILEAVNNFLANLEASNEMGIGVIREKFEELRDLSDSINSMWSSVCLLQFLNSCVGVCIGLHLVFTGNGDIQRIYILFNCVGFIGWSLLSAKCCQVKECIVEFLVKRLKYLRGSDRDEMNVLLEEIRASIICIGSVGVFQINYGFISEAFLMILTFFFIFLQSID